MLEKLNATCSICGKKYHRCDSCKDKVAVAPWQAHCDTSEHYKVYQIIHGYTTGVYTEDEAREKFSRVNISDVDSFRDNIKEIVKKITGSSVKTKEEKPEITSKPVVETKKEYDNKGFMKYAQKNKR